MARARSPKYPSISLKEAVDRATAVYERDYQNPIPREVIAGHMGYSGITGKSLGVLASLTRFGLLEGRGNDSRISDLAVRIIAHPVGSPERAAALQEAAVHPDLFAELDQRFAAGGSDQALRAHLLTRKFIPSAAEAAIRAYRETRQFVESESGVPGEVAEMPNSPTFPEASGRRAAVMQPKVGTGRSLSFAQLLRPSGDPYRIEVTPNGIDVSARLMDKEGLEKLVQVLAAMQALLPDRKAVKLSIEPDAEPKDVEEAETITDSA